MNDFYRTAPGGGGQGLSAPSTVQKYAFDSQRIILFDVEVYPNQPSRWCVGFLAPDGKHAVVDGDRSKLAEILDTLHQAGRTLVGYNSASYDISILRAILAGEDPYPVSRALVHHDGPGLPPELRDRAARWPTIRADHVDLAARTRMNGRIPSLKTVAANLGVKHLQELPYDPTKPVTDAEWIEIKQYNRKDLAATRAPLDHFAPELEAIAALSARYGCDLRSTHQAGIAQRILVTAYRTKHGLDPIRIVPPASVRYTPPDPVQRPQNPAAAAWFDRLISEAFPMEEGAPPKVPEPGAPIIIGGVTLTVGSGGLHSSDQPALHRSDTEWEIYEADVASYYPSMMARFGIFPRSLGECGLEQFKEVLAERLDVKGRAGTATDPAIQKRLKVQAHGLKIVLNSTFGQFGNPYSVLYDPTAFLAVTLTGQLMLIDLLERLDSAGAEILSVNTDGLYFKVRRDEEAWCKTLESWEVDSGMVLETTPVDALVIEATNHYAIMYADGRVKRRGNLSDVVDWKHVPKHQIVSDAVVAALFDGILPETTIRRCVDPAKFVSITRRDSSKVGVLVNDATGAETPLPRLTRWYKAKDSPYRIEHRWRSDDGKEHKSTPPGASGVQLLMDLPDGPLGDIDLGWYVGEARARILANRDFPHLDPKWLEGHVVPLELHARGLAPSPHWDGKKSPKGARKDHPSYFWEWGRRYDAFGTYTGPDVGVLVLDIDEPPKFRKWLESAGAAASLLEQNTLDGCMVSYHRADSPEAVRAGSAKGKLIFRYRADEDSPLAKVSKAALRSTLGIEIFYGKEDATVFGVHPDGPGSDYLLSDGPLGPPPDWLLADLVERASKKVRPASPKEHTPGGTGNGATSNLAAVAKYAKAALESEVAKVEAAPEGERNETIWKASCAIGGLIGAGALDRELAEERLIGATSLPPEEAADVIRRGLDRGAESPRDLGHVVGRNGDGHERPTIEITTEEHEVNDQAVAALGDDPDLYQRGHLLVRVLRDGPRPDDMECGRDPGGLTIMPVHTSTLRERLTKYAHWVKRKRGEDGEWTLAPVHPPDWTVPAVMNRGSWEGVRFLEGVTEVPLFLPDGTVLETPGYDRRSGILYLPEILYPKVPDAPTREDAAAAANLLLDVVVDFPFKGPEHQSAWLAALLTPLARPAVAGCAPLFVFDANAAGTGKSMLCDIISLVGCGRQVGRTAYPTTEEEMNKSMLSIALGGARLVLFDNSATGAAIGGACLDAALTATTYSGRVLGISKFVADVPLAATFYVTGNNITLKGDTLRRVVLSRLETSEDHPEERDGFAVPDLIGSVRARRGELAVAALTILRAYIVAGRPAPDPRPKPMGGFEAWSELVRRATHWATGFDPCATKSEAKAADKTATQLPALIEGWARLCRSINADSLSTAQAIKVLESSPEDHATLYAVLTETTRDGRLPSPQGLGNLLGKVRGRPHAGRSLERTETYGVNQWFVKVSQPGTPTVQEPAALPAEDDLPF